MKEKWELYHDTVISFGDGGIDVRNAPKANERAKLIAAAPALLEALELMTDVYCKRLSEGGWNPDLDPEVIKSRAAIAAAKGE